MLGQGTAEVESLPSYIFRLAYEHGVSVGTLLPWVYRVVSGGTILKKPHLSGKKGTYTISRINSYSEELRVFLAELTGQDLSCWPLKFLDEHIYQISTEIEGFRWCPECLSEMSLIDTPRYNKQIWHMRGVTHCNLHRTPLVQYCSMCGKEQALISSEHPFGWCGFCGNSLSKRVAPLTESDVQPSWDCISNDLLEIFTRCAREDMIDNDVFSSLGLMDSLVPKCDPEIKSGDIIVRRELAIALANEVITNGKSCKLISLRRLAYELNLSLYELLIRSPEISLFSVRGVDVEDLPDQMKPRKKNPRNHKQEYQNILKLLEDQEAPPSLKSLARMADVSVGYLEYRFPSLVRRVVEKFQDYQTRHKLAVRYRAQAAALSFFTDKRYSVYNQSRKEAYRVLRAETGLPKWVLKNAIQTAYQVLQTGG